MEESSYLRLFELARSALEQLESHEHREFGPEIARRLAERTGQAERPPSTTECHVLDQVWKGTATAARIAENLGMTRGGVSKAIAKLAARGYVETPRSKENGREVALALTPRGQALCEIHAQMHAEMLASWADLLEDFSEEERATITRFLQGVSRISG